MASTGQKNEQTIQSKPRVKNQTPIWEIFKTATLLGLTSFGGPVAHIGYFHKMYVEKKQWVDEKQFVDLVALSQFLPGPASSQVGIGIGAYRGGILGAIAAWVGFTLPSAIVLLLFAMFVKEVDVSQAGWLHGLRVVAVAIVAHALLTMGKKLAAEKITATIAVVACAITLLWQTALTQVAVMLMAAIVGYLIYHKKEAGISPSGFKENQKSSGNLKTIGHKRTNDKHQSLWHLLIFCVALAALPVLNFFTGNQLIQLIDIFYRAGSLVFGGGHVILPLLEMELVPKGLLTDSQFLSGFGATQAVPGPLFTFATYLGYLVAGLPGAIVSLLAVFTPSFLLVMGVLPYWDALRTNTKVKSALIGVNAAVVGILLAALYNPLWIKAITSTKDFVLCMGLFVLINFWKAPTWLMVILGAVAGSLLL